MAAACLGSFIIPFMISSVNTALPTIGIEFNLDAVSLNWIATSYLLSSSVFMLPMGRVADLYGRKRIYMIGMLLFSLTCIFLAFVKSYAVFIALRAFQGLGSAMIFSTSSAILTSVIPARRRGKSLGYSVASVYAGLSFGPFLGGVLTQSLGWRSIFLCVLPFAVAVLYLIKRHIPMEWAEARGNPFDVTGTVLWALALPAGMAGVSLLPTLNGFLLLAVSAVLTLAFIVWEAKCASPILRVTLFRDNRVFAFSNLASMINYSATYALSFLLSLYLQVVRGFSPRTAGLILVAQPVMMMLFSPLAGRLSDRHDARVLASVGMGCTAIGLFFLTTLTGTTPIPILVLFLGFMGFGFGLFSSPNINSIMSSVEPADYGLASGITGTMRILGQMMSMGVAILIFAVFLGSARVTPAIAPEFLKAAQAAFLIFAIFCSLGIFASMARGKR